jgi:hypothetical protein
MGTNSHWQTFLAITFWEHFKQAYRGAPVAFSPFLLLLPCLSVCTKIAVVDRVLNHFPSLLASSVTLSTTIIILRVSVKLRGTLERGAFTNPRTECETGA